MFILKLQLFIEGMGVFALMKIIALTHTNQPLTPLIEVSQMLKPTLSQTVQVCIFFPLKQNICRTLHL